MILVIPIVVSLAIGLLTGGSLAHLGHIRFRYLPLLVAALLAQVAIFSPILGTRDIIHRIGPYIYIGTILLTLLALIKNFHIPGLKIIAIGAALNALVIIANGGFMPSPESALREAGALDRVDRNSQEAVDGSYVFTNSTIADDDTNLRFLGDVIPVPDRIPLANVISIGDIVIAIGASVAILRTMHRRADDAVSLEATRRDSMPGREPAC